MKLSIADYFSFLQSRWEELAQYEPLTDFLAEVAEVLAQRLETLHTYQFLMGLKLEFESLRIQILNTTPMPSLYEAFAILDSDERRRRLLPAPSTTPIEPTPIPYQMAFVANVGPRSSNRKVICHYCNIPGYTKDQCFKLHPELKQ